MGTTEQEIVKAVLSAVDEINRAVSKANDQGFRVDFEEEEIHVYGKLFPYHIFSVAIYKYIDKSMTIYKCAGEPNEAKL